MVVEAVGGPGLQPSAWNAGRSRLDVVFVAFRGFRIVIFPGGIFSLQVVTLFLKPVREETKEPIAPRSTPTHANADILMTVEVQVANLGDPSSKPELLESIPLATVPSVGLVEIAILVAG